MGKRRAAGLAIIGAMAAGHAAGQIFQPPITQLTHTESEFSFDLFAKLGRRPGDFVVSPYSAANALDMVFLGAQGTTADQMAQALHVNELAGTDKSAALAAVVKSRQLVYNAANWPNGIVVMPSDGFQFEDADSLWGAQGEPFKPAYLTAVKTAFGGSLQTVDFAAPQLAAARINAWVSDKTHGRISNLISAADLPRATRLVLTDAVYFKAGWAEDFDEAASKPGKFHTEAGPDVTVRMMHATQHAMMTRGEGMQMLQIPYRYDNADLLIILPDDPNGLPAVEAELSADRLAYWLEYAQQFNVAMSIPAFTTSSAFDLNAALQALGITNAFTPFQADLSRIADDAAHPLYIGDVVQKADIDVHEKGTEAAAATGVTGEATLAWEPPLEDVNFTADHPFIYIIRAAGGDILFMGRVEDPQPAANP